MSEVKKIPLRGETIEAVLNYLAERPYRESAHLIAMILRETNAHPPEEAITPDVENRADADR